MGLQIQIFLLQLSSNIFFSGDFQVSEVGRIGAVVLATPPQSNSLFKKNTKTTNISFNQNNEVFPGLVCPSTTDKSKQVVHLRRERAFPSRT